MLWWAVCFFGLGFIGMEFATIFTNALMPSLSEHEDLGSISGSGFAFGYLGGVIAVLAMSIGTAITVSILATLAVTAKGAAVRFAGNGMLGVRIGTAIEIGGALLVMVMGLLLLGASLQA